MSYSLTTHTSQGYRFLPTTGPYSWGVTAEPGYEILGLTFSTPPTVEDGLVLIDQELRRRGLPPHALVAMSLRSPEPFGFGAFDDFNDVYQGLLRERELFEGALNPIARTNVVPVHAPPRRPVLAAAFILRPARGAGGTDFVVAGIGEIDGSLAAENIVARGDLSEEGVGRKVGFVLAELRARLAALGRTPGDPTTLNVYTALDIAGLSEALADQLPAVGDHGFVRWLARPPLLEVDFELDCHRVSGWRVL